MTTTGHAGVEMEMLHETATGIFLDAIETCSIEAAFDRRLRFTGDTLERLIPGDTPASINLKDFRRIFVIAIGKAAGPMVEVLGKRMTRRDGVRGICCSVSIPEKRSWRFRYFEGGHPLPNEGSLQAAKAALALLEQAHRDTLVIYLISGGGSALFDLPLDPSISLDDTIAFHRVLLGCGAPIAEINALRKRFSAVKGGRLAQAAGEATQISLLLPDVPIRALDALSSGPTIPNATTEAEVKDLLAKYDLLAQFPASVRAWFERENPPETRERRGLWAPLMARIAHQDSASARVHSPRYPAMFELLLSSHDLVEGARAHAEAAGFYTVVDNGCDDWDYADAAQYLLERFHALRAEHGRCCLISGGEVTVKLSREPGAGGRNQQFALTCALELARFAGHRLLVLSAGSDGIDGNTRSAGAIADTATVSRARSFGYDPEKSLAAFDACPLFTALGDTVVTGPTGHNLRDLRLLIADEG